MKKQKIEEEKHLNKMSVAKIPRLSNKLSSNGAETNGNGKKTDNVEEWHPEDGTR